MNPERIYTVIRAPHISEKSTLLGDKANQYTFKVAVDATKPEIKEAIETIFKVKVTGVTTANVKGKVKRTARGPSRKNNWKKAYVRVADGQEIDFMVTD
ncbi:MAG: 50S ribosomal protein L23 [Pseudomonadales bacterium]|nr:50S ribosomal protein L23 [Pseudomonadales bacterium]